jgi:UDP-2-acetamido-2,6-beta-L-arabino-hexul-4-ose reductase
MMKVLITGSSGFIGSSIKEKFSKENTVNTVRIDRNTNLKDLDYLLDVSTHIFHCSSVTRSEDEKDFFEINFEINTLFYSLLQKKKNKTIFVFSSIHHNFDSIYGISKRYSEFLYNKLSENNKVFINRLPGIFGANAKVNYVSVVSTFSHGIKYNIEFPIVNPEKVITLLYIDDLLLSFINQIEENKHKKNGTFIKNIYDKSFNISVGDLYKLIKNFENNKNNNLSDSQKKILLVYNKI